MILRTIKTSRYKIEHSVGETSRLSDYDYDPCRPERRFFSSYMHSLNFTDNITDTDILRIGFPSEVWANIISAVYRIMYGSPDISSVLSTIGGINLSDYPNVTIDLMVYLDQYCPDLITLMFSLGREYWKLDFTRDDMEKFISILEIDEIEDLYVMYSSDRS